MDWNVNKQKNGKSQKNRLVDMKQKSNSSNVNIIWLTVDWLSQSIRPVYVYAYCQLSMTCVRCAPLAERIDIRDINVLITPELMQFSHIHRMCALCSDHNRTHFQKLHEMEEFMWISSTTKDLTRILNGFYYYWMNKQFIGFLRLKKIYIGYKLWRLHILYSYTYIYVLPSENRGKRRRREQRKPRKKINCRYMYM